jgi:hypothetical protein
VTCRSSYTHLTRLTFLRNLWVVVYSNVSSGSHPKLCSFWNFNAKLVYHSVWISMYKTYTFTDKATECLQSWSPFMVFLQRQIIIKIHVLPNHVIQDTMYIVARCLSALVLHLSAKIPTFERKKIHDWAQIYLCGRKFKISSYNVGFKTLQYS